MTVAASRGVTGATVPSSTSRARAAKCGGSRMAARRPAGGSVTDRYDQLDLHRRVERQHRGADGAAGVPADLAENLEQEFAGPVDDLRLGGEAGVAGHETR